jgi:RNA polymerase sigma-70 factor (ECF subfamily)
MDEATFELFYKKTARPLWLYLHRVSGDAALAEDILQESFYRLLRAALANMDEAQMRAYLYKIATNLLRDYWRGRKREQKFLVENNPEKAAPPDPTENQDLTRALQALNLQERSLLWLAYVEGNEHREIAQILSLSEKSIRVLLFRARQKLAKLLSQEERP